MKTLITIVFSLSLAVAAEAPKAEPPKLTDRQVAELYKLLAENTAAQTRAKETQEAFASKVKELELTCGGPLTETPGKLAGCAPQPVATTPAPKKETPK